MPPTKCGFSETAVKPEVWVLSSYLMEAISLGSSNSRVAGLLEVQLWDIQSSLGELFLRLLFNMALPLVNITVMGGSLEISR